MQSWWYYQLSSSHGLLENCEWYLSHSPSLLLSLPSSFPLLPPLPPSSSPSPSSSLHSSLLKKGSKVLVVQVVTEVELPYMHMSCDLFSNSFSQLRMKQLPYL